MAFVTLSADPDVAAWISPRFHRYAEELGVVLKGVHELMLFDRVPDDPLNAGKTLGCRCGWKKHITWHFWELTKPHTTNSVWLHDALKEHVLSFTDPTHYTYYPQGV
jgi:hypothetical protein